MSANGLMLNAGMCAVLALSTGLAIDEPVPESIWMICI